MSGYPQVCGPKQDQEWSRQEIHVCCGPKQAQNWPRDLHLLRSGTGSGLVNRSTDLWSETGSGLAKISTGLWSETGSGLAKRSTGLWSETGSGVVKRSTSAVVRNRPRIGQEIHVCSGPEQAQDWSIDPWVCGPKQAEDCPRDPQVCGPKEAQDWRRDPQVCGPKQVQECSRYAHVLWSETGQRNCSRNFSIFVSTELTRQGHCPPL